ncbi:MAG: hypothetical protein M1817_006903 [Caeruleum heppii]|nr:MAG: hypothetical protein M1817_006903 [Caeruleum heppii]
MPAMLSIFLVIFLIFTHVSALPPPLDTDQPPSAVPLDERDITVPTLITIYSSNNTFYPWPVAKPNCKGSSKCRGLDRDDCALSMGSLETAYLDFINGPVSTTIGHCTTFYVCEDKEDYVQDFLKITTIVDWLHMIWDEGGCEKCGSVHLGKSCRVTINYTTRRSREDEARVGL